jgi:hypothetical protein
VKIHLCDSPEPLREGENLRGLCEALVLDAQFAFVWDETPMHEAIAESLNALTVCRKCIRLAQEKPLANYVYAIRLPERTLHRGAA